MAAKERREMLDMPKNKKSPFDSPMHAFVSFTSEKVYSVYFGLFLKWLWFYFSIQTDTALIVNVVCRDTSGQVSALPNI